MKNGFLWLGLLLSVLCGIAHGQTKSVTYYYTDPQGTPLAEADASGNVTASFDYQAYGSLALGSAESGPGYTGHIADSDAELVYMQARYYDPAIGRFLSTDPVALKPGDSFNPNRYAYANNNSYRFTDPDGRCIDACVTEGAVVIGGATVYVAAASLVAIGVCVEACGKIQGAIEHAGYAALAKVSESLHLSEDAPALPTGVVGEEPRATGKNGGTAVGTSLPAGKFADTVKDLTGGTLSQPDSKGRSTSPNGVSVRTGGKTGPRIDIPANGTKPPEIIHFPEDTPIPDHLKPTT